MPTQTKRVRSRKKNQGDSLLTKEFERFRTLRIVAVISILAIAILVLVGLFAPGLRYSLVAPPEVPVEAQAFLNELEPLVSSKITRNNQIGRNSAFPICGHDTSPLPPRKPARAEYTNTIGCDI